MGVVSVTVVVRLLALGVTFSFLALAPAAELDVAIADAAANEAATSLGLESSMKYASNGDAAESGLRFFCATQRKVDPV